MSAMTKVGTISGASIDLLEPDWRDINLSDVAHGLVKIRRFNGQSKRDIVVAEHSRLVARLAPPKFRLAALLHDAHEFALGDIITPAARAIAAIAPAAGPAIERLKQALDIAICRQALHRFGQGFCEPEGEDYASRELAREMRSPEVKFADAKAFDIESRMLGRAGVPPIGFDGPRYLPDQAPDAADIAIDWLGEVSAACAARYGRGAAQ